MKLSSYGITYDVEPIKMTYLDGNLCVRLISKNGSVYGNLTTNLGFKLKENEAYVDVNNFPDAEKFIKENNLGKRLNKIGRSGFCEYPLYKFY